MAFAVNLVGGGWNWIRSLTGGTGMNQALKTDVDKVLRGVGGYLVDQLRRNIVSRGSLFGEPFVENAPLTIKIKGHDKPLIDKGDMINAITYKQIGDMKFMVGILDQKLAQRGAFLEVGGMTEINGRHVMVPARPWMGPMLVHQGVRQSAKSLFIAGMANLGHKFREGKL